MIEVNGNKYKLLLLDTNALSNLLKDSKKWIKYIDSKFSIAKTVICYSAFTLCEITRRKDLFVKYIELFSIFPSAILDGFDSIYKKELENYDKSNSKISPIVILPYALRDDTIKSPQEKLRKVIEISGFHSKSDYWINSRKSILDNIISLKDNFKSSGSKFIKKEIEEFVYYSTLQQIILRNMNFANNIVKVRKEEMDVYRFPSIISTSYVVFYKFYPDKRKPVASDIIDIIISSLLPYVDYFITEGHLNEIVNRMQKIHSYLPDLKSYSIRDIKKYI